jgi:predicted metal-dependent phosphoesterase TrpH
MKADLHLHTTASDGMLEPQEVVDRASGLGLEVIAITDHDSVSGIPAALEQASNFPGLLVIPGVEINTDIARGEAHVLGYFISDEDADFNNALCELRESRYRRGQRMTAKLAEMGVEVDWARVLELARGGSIGRPHIAQAMLEQGYVSSLRQAFTDYIGRDGPAYIERKKLTPLEAVKLILKVDGLPVLAHPASIEHLESLVGKLKKAGLAGIEIYYTGYTPNTIARLQDLAKRYDLVATGGSDFHGLDNTIGADIGSVDLPRDCVDQLLSLGERKRMVLP